MVLGNYGAPAKDRYKWRRRRNKAVGSVLSVILKIVTTIVVIIVLFFLVQHFRLIPTEYWGEW